MDTSESSSTSISTSISPPPPPLLKVKLANQEAVSALLACRTKALADSKGLPFAVIQELDLYNGELEVSVNLIKAAFQVVKRHRSSSSAASNHDGETAFYTNVLKGAKTIFPLHDKRKADAMAKDKKIEAWRQQLRARDQQRQYDRMVQNVHWGGGKKPDIETRGMYQASVSFNLMAAIITAGFLGYYVAGSFVPKESHRMVVGTLSAIVMLMIEMSLYIIRTTEVERYKTKRERNEELGRKGLSIPPSNPLLWDDGGSRGGYRRRDGGSSSQSSSLGLSGSSSTKKGGEKQKLL